MSTPTWHSVTPPVIPRPQGTDWLRLCIRAPLVIMVLLLGLCVFGLIRIIEWPLNGSSRPLTPYVTQCVCKCVLGVLGLSVTRIGAPIIHGGIVVANHSSWLDILVLNSGQRITFLSKAEVAGWPGIGLLARITGTLFIARDRRAAQAHVAAVQERVNMGQQLLMFPEGTSSDGLRVLPFKSTLFAAFFGAEAPSHTVQPVTVDYHAPSGADARFYGWWGNMDLAPHVLAVLGARQGRITVTYSRPVQTGGFSNRKLLSANLEQTVRQSHHHSGSHHRGL